jgi:3-oxoadipate enol-lactonase
MSTVELAYVRHGPDGRPPLLLGGSLGTTHAMWAPQVQVLSGRLNTIAFDHRGHGRSPVPDGPYSIATLGGDVLALMDHLGLERASYCGLSLGGMVGQWLAINAPQRIDRLILISTAAHLPPARGWRERAELVRDAGSPAAVADTVVGRWFTPEFAGRRPDVVDEYRGMIASTPPEGYAACCEAIADYDVRPGLPSVPVPTLVIAGAQDPAAPPELGRAIADAVPGARFELLDPAAHLASVERADRVTSLIAEHLETGASHE